MMPLKSSLSPALARRSRLAGHGSPVTARRSRLAAKRGEGRGGRFSHFSSSFWFRPARLGDAPLSFGAHPVSFGSRPVPFGGAPHSIWGAPRAAWGAAHSVWAMPHGVWGAPHTVWGGSFSLKKRCFTSKTTSFLQIPQIPQISDPKNSPICGNQRNLRTPPDGQRFGISISHQTMK
jgi:hypothetical protein